MTIREAQESRSTTAPAQKKRRRSTTAIRYFFLDPTYSRTFLSPEEKHKDKWAHANQCTPRTKPYKKNLHLFMCFIALTRAIILGGRQQMSYGEKHKWSWLDSPAAQISCSGEKQRTHGEFSNGRGGTDHAARRCCSCFRSKCYTVPGACVSCPCLASRHITAVTRVDNCFAPRLIKGYREDYIQR